ncbi:MAG: MBOAT family protein [Bacteroidetes bacterium]|nr:MBOAT family protein [Bacteroidota bacterium]
MEGISRLTTIFGFDYDSVSPLIFTQLNFWFFFVAVMGLYVLLDLDTKWKTICTATAVTLGLVFFQFYDTALLLLAVGLNAFYLLSENIESSEKKRSLLIINLGYLGYLVYKLFFDRLYFGLSYVDFWLLFIVFVFLLARMKKTFLVRSVFLTVVSLFFYFKSSGFYVCLLSASLVLNFFMGKWIFVAETEKRKKLIIGLTVTLNVLILGYFKYAYFFTSSFNDLFHTNVEVFNHFARWGNGFMGEGTFVERILLPVGVSFFTFQSISYIVDIYRKEIEPVNHFFHYTFFVTFFPQLVAGPIVRAKDFIPQIKQPFQLQNSDFSWAVIQVVKGLIKKIVLADYIAIHFIDQVADSPEAYPGFVSILAMWGYSLQIYGDFSGYTDIAIGLSRLMGFKLLENFNSPYKATSVADFWRRWHKSLGSWLRDYLYIPLGGNRTGGIGTYVATLIIFFFLLLITGWYALIFVYIGLMILYIYGVLFIKNFKKYIHRDLNLLITMVIGGLWHGASVNFVIWGAMNGCALILYNYWKRISPYEANQGRLVHFWKIFLTFNFITFTRIWFRLEGDGQPELMLDRIMNHFGFEWSVFVQVIETYQAVFVVMILGYIVHWVPQAMKTKWELKFEAMPLYAKALSVCVILIAMYQAVSDVSKPFVYFQF